MFFCIFSDHFETQGVFIRMPVIEKQMVDLHALHRAVADEGGYETCVQDKKWMKIALQLYSKCSFHFHQVQIESSDLEKKSK